MPVSLQVREGEAIAAALRRFHRLVHQELATPWAKRRYGYYEKPSALRRKRRRREPPLRLGLAAQWARSGPTNAVGR